MNIEKEDYKDKILDLDFNEILNKYCINNEYSEEIIDEINNFKNFKIPEQEYRNRKDLRNLFTVTMDSLTAKDFDDAYSLELIDGIFNLYVHIADVSYFVQKDSLLDKDALSRGNSYYLGPWVVHMLPPILSENLCSLKENEDRLTITCELKIDNQGKIINYDIYRSIINVDKRIPYEIGNQILKEKKDENYAFLKLSTKLQEILYKSRINKGSLQFDFPDYYFIFKDSYIVPSEIVRYERGICERVIEEFMLCANKVIAIQGSKLKNFIYRIHDKPEKNNFMHQNFNEFKNDFTHKQLNYILSAVKNTDRQYAIESMILKSLKKANYDNKNIGHFGLNFEKYTHFTSPIRRYSDLVVHRLILKEKYSNDELKKISILTSLKEQIAIKAEEDYNKIKNAHFLKKFLLKNFDVIVVGIIPKGIFCRIEKYGCEGLLSSKKLKEKGYLYNKKLNSFESGEKRDIIKIGSHLNLILIKADPKNGFIDFSFDNKIKRIKGEKKQKKRRYSGRHDTID